MIELEQKIEIKQEQTINPEDQRIQRNMIERASLIRLLRNDQIRLAKEIAELDGKSNLFDVKKKEILERQLEGMDGRLRRAIVLDFN